VLHPFADAGTFEAREPHARFRIEGSYFDEGPYSATFARHGHEITFASHRHTLETYVTFLRSAGLAVEALREPTADPAAVIRDPSEERWTRVPLFLALLAVKLPRTVRSDRRSSSP
jgi:hypothetical protein